MQFLVNIGEKFLVLFATFLCVDFVPHFLGMIGNDELVFLLVERANANVGIIIWILFVICSFIFGGLDIADIVPLALTGINLIVLSGKARHRLSLVSRGLSRGSQKGQYCQTCDLIFHFYYNINLFTDFKRSTMVDRQLLEV